MSCTSESKTSALEARGDAEELPDPPEHGVEQRDRHPDLDPRGLRLGGDPRLHPEVRGAHVPLELADRARAALPDELGDPRAEVVLRLGGREEAHEAPRAVLDEPLGEERVELAAHPAREVDERCLGPRLLEDDLEERGVRGSDEIRLRPGRPAASGTARGRAAARR